MTVTHNNVRGHSPPEGGVLCLDCSNKTAAALELGFFPRRLWGLDKGSPAVSFRSAEIIKVAVDRLSDEMQTNRLMRLHQRLVELDALREVFVQRPDWASALRQRYRGVDDSLLPPAVVQWCDASISIVELASGALPKGSGLWTCYVTGDAIGRISFLSSVIEKPAGHEGTRRLWAGVQQNVRLLIEAGLTYDPWLNSLCNEAVGIGPQHLLNKLAEAAGASMPTRVGFCEPCPFMDYPFPEAVRDLTTFCEFAIQRLWVALQFSACDFCKEVAREGQPQAAAGADGEVDAGAEDAKPPTLTWEADNRQLLINGETLEQYQGKAIINSRWDNRDFERNAWIYLMYTQNMHNKEICAGIKNMGRKWTPINEPTGIRPRAVEFAKRLGLPIPPKRPAGAPPRNRG